MTFDALESAIAANKMFTNKMALELYDKISRIYSKLYITKYIYFIIYIIKNADHLRDTDNLCENNVLRWVFLIKPILF